MNVLTPFANMNKTKSSSKELQAAVKRVIDNINNQEQVPKFNSMKQALEDKAKVEKRNAKNLFSYENVSTLVAERYLVDVDLLWRATRKREVVDARQEIGFIMYYSLTGYTYKVIGGYMGGRDHSTVIHSCMEVIKRMDTTPGYRKEIVSIFKALDPKFNFRKKGLGYLLRV